MKKKETVLLVENWRKFIKENSDEDENIFRSFEDPKKPVNNVLDSPSDTDESSDNENFYASREPGEPEEDNAIYDLNLIKFCRSMGIDCNKNSLIEFLKNQAADSNLNIHGEEHELMFLDHGYEVDTAHGEEGSIYGDEEH